MNKIQTNKESILNVNILNALRSISMNAQKSKTPETSEMIKTNNENIYETKLRVNPPLVREKQVRINMTAAVTQSQIHIHWE